MNGVDIKGQPRTCPQESDGKGHYFTFDGNVGSLACICGWGFNREMVASNSRRYAVALRQK